MVNYWDASAIVTLLAGEPAARRYRSFGNEEIVTWWGTALECISAIARRSREGASAEIITEAYRRLEKLQLAWREVQPNERVRRAAARLLKTHPLRTGDSLHLAAALIVSQFEPSSIRFLTEDTQLRLAAEKEGFVVP